MAEGASNLMSFFAHRLNALGVLGTVCEKSASAVPGSAGCQPTPVATRAGAITAALARASLPTGSRRSQDFSQTLPTALRRGDLVT